MPQNRVSDTIMHVTLDTNTNVVVLRIYMMLTSKLTLHSSHYDNL